MNGIAAAAAVLRLAAGSFSADEPGQQAAIKSAVTGVRLDVSALDGASTIRGLTSSNFEVLDNNQKQQFSVIENTEAPLDLVLVMQPVASMTVDRQELARWCITFLGRSLSADDRVAIIAATGPPAVVLPLSAPNTNLPTAFGDVRITALREAMIRAITVLDRLSDRRKAIVVVTDGQDDQSWITEAGIVAAADRMAAQVIAVGVDTTSSRMAYTAWNNGRTAGENVSKQEGIVAVQLPRWLTDVVDRSGGRSLDVRSETVFSQLETLLTHLRAQYVVTYAPTDSRPGWHRVRISLKGKRGSVVTRAGYWK